MESLSEHLKVSCDLLCRLSFNLTGDALEVVQVPLPERPEELLIISERPIREAGGKLRLVAILEILGHQLERVDQMLDLLRERLQRLKVVVELELVDLL